jgi:hypothetical protein
MTRFVCLVFALPLYILCFLAASPVQADTLPEGFIYNGTTYTSITVPGATSVTPMGVNNAGQVVGGYSTGGDYEVFSFGSAHTFDVTGVTQFAFSYIGGTLGTLTGLTSNTGAETGYIQASAINNSGTIVGYGGFVSPNGEAAFSYQSGTFTTFVAPGSLGGLTTARGINDSGQIVGTFLNPSNVTPPPYFQQIEEGYLYSGGSYQVIDAPGATITELLGINNNGQILGEEYSASNGGSFFVYSGGVFTNISIPCAGQAALGGINNNNQIGVNCISGFQESAFIYNYVSDTSTPISPPDAAYTYVTGISDDGNVVGYYSAPESSTLVLLSTGLLLVLGSLCRKAHV